MYTVINTLIHRAKTVCNKLELLQKEMDHLTKALTHCTYPKWATEWVERRLTKPTSEESNDANIQGTAGTKPTTNKVKIRVIQSYLTPRVYVKASKRSVVSMAYRPTLMVIAPLKPPGLLQGQGPHGKQKWTHLLVPMWGPSM